MKIGCPREVKDNENRVGLTPNAARAYVAAGHEVFVQKDAGLGSSIPDEKYQAAGATILPDADALWRSADMITKVKEPMPEEYDKMREGQLIYTYFHFAADETLTRACLDRKIVALAYETVEEDNGTLPLLKPMSEVAGRMAPLMGAFYLAKPQGGPGILPMGVTGVAPANVLVIGGGAVGTDAARIAAGYGADVTILDINLSRLEYLGHIMPKNVNAVYSDQVNLERYLKTADIVIGAVLIPGAMTPKVIKKEHLKIMKPGSILIDIAIDQGGCSETSHPTSHSNPVYVVDGVTHYCVGNMPGAYARTSTFALNYATIKYGLMLADKGVEKACRENAALKKGLNMYKGTITFKAVAEAFNLMDKYNDADTVIA